MMIFINIYKQFKWVLRFCHDPNVGGQFTLTVAVEALTKKERGMKLSLEPQFVEKLVWVPDIYHCL
jgi:hypothetical protein